MRPWGITRASLWGSWGSLGRSKVIWRLLGVLSRSLGDPVGDLVPHMLRTPMFQRFALFSAECVLGGGPWEVLGVHEHESRVYYVF